MGLALVLLIILIGCSSKTDNQKNQQSSVEWVDVVKWQDKKYYYNEKQTNTITKDDIGKEIGEITFTVVGSEEEKNPNYELKNTEATFIGKGTKIYKINNDENVDMIYIQNKVYTIK